jgi:glutamate-1-semialdehyde 2,1-aminomutase
MAAGLKTLEIISRPGFFEALTQTTTQLLDGLHAAATANDIALRSNQVGAMFGLFFTDQPEVSNFTQVSACDVERFQQFFHGMLSRGVNLAPSAYEAGFVSAMHGAHEIEHSIAAAAACFADMRTQN